MSYPAAAPTMPIRIVVLPPAPVAELPAAPRRRPVEVLALLTVGFLLLGAGAALGLGAVLLVLGGLL
jgi:hypothetical protein